MQVAKQLVVVLLCIGMSPRVLLSQTAGAMLSASGQVTVNGHPVANSIAIFPGDRIETAAGAGATISGPGVSAQVGQSSAVTWQAQMVQFENGAALVAAQAPWHVRIGDMDVALGTEATKIEVTQREDVSLIKLLQGSATLNEGGQSTALKVGFTVARPNAAGMHPAAAATGAKHSSHTALILVGVGGGAAAGIGVALGSKGSNSQQRPATASVP